MMISRLLFLPLLVYLLLAVVSIGCVVFPAFWLYRRRRGRGARDSHHAAASATIRDRSALLIRHQDVGLTFGGRLAPRRDGFQFTPISRSSTGGIAK